VGILIAPGVPGVTIRNNSFYDDQSPHTMQYAISGMPGSDSLIQNNSFGSGALAVNPFPACTSVYREYDAAKGWHMMSLTPNENSPTYALEGLGFYLYSSAVDASSVQLYRCSYASGYFVSTDPGCEGQTFNYALGWAHRSAEGAEVPIYRFYAPWNGDHLITVNPAEGYNNGYTFEAILGYTQP
jgi:hypothetical protein